jgi:RsiW-degrading membrane proteinase PrsW (M82 family)
MAENLVKEEKSENPFWSVTGTLLLGNLSLLFIVMLPQIFQQKAIHTAVTSILFLSYYYATLVLGIHYAEKTIPKVKSIYIHHSIAIKRIGAIIGMIILFLILSVFMGYVEVLKIYGVGLVTWLLSFLIPKKNSDP